MPSNPALVPVSQIRIFYQPSRELYYLNFIMAPGRLESPMPQAPNGVQSYSDDIYGSYHPADPDTLSLESNYGPMEPGSVGYLQPTSFDTPLEIMHERFERDGYLFVRWKFYILKNRKLTWSQNLLGETMHSQRSLPQMP